MAITHIGFDNAHSCVCFYLAYELTVWVRVVVLLCLACALVCVCDRESHTIGHVDTCTLARLSGVIVCLRAQTVRLL